MGKANYGTAIGGYVSLTARIVILTFAALQIWACFFFIKNYEQELSSQLPTPNTESFEMSYNSGFPAFQIFLPTEGKVTDPSEVQGSINDPDVFSWHFLYNNLVDS